MVSSQAAPAPADGLPSEPAEEVRQVSKPEDTIVDEGTELHPLPPSTQELSSLQRAEQKSPAPLNELY